MRKIELLAPAKNYQTGIAAINCGADAVYIGCEKFGARSTAGNSIRDIEKLIEYAHVYHARVYSALNTILYDNELEEASGMIKDLYNAGIDAVIIQDMGILEMDIPPVPLHASTQCDNYDPARISFLDRIGFPRVILARELNIEQIREIRDRTSCELEVFIHGALCVSLSGRCYMSAAMGGRSANRGECAQPCRKNYTLTDAGGKVISRAGYPLSLKDLNLTDYLEDLITAGVNSLKIEGRLKDINYVKNVVSHYRKKLDLILEGRDAPAKSSSGKIFHDFNPDPCRTFNRGYTSYFITGKKIKISSPHTPKSLGKFCGRVTETGKNWFRLDPGEKINNGDGLAFFSRDNSLTGIKINNTDNGRIFPRELKGIYPGASVYRNHDTEFEKTLSNTRTVRKIDISMEMSESPDGFRLTITDEDGCAAASSVCMKKETVHSGIPDDSLIKKHLGKTGGTVFSASAINIVFNKPYFIPVTAINQLRRDAVEKLLEARKKDYKKQESFIEKTDCPYPYKMIDFRHNVNNRLSEKFYRNHGVETVEWSFEISEKPITGPIMTTKFCLKHENDLCPLYNKKSTGFIEPFYLGNKQTLFKLEFDCKNCFMLIYSFKKEN